MGTWFPAGKRASLFNTEPVLFIDHRKTEPWNFDLLLQKCVGSDDEIGFAFGNHLLDTRFNGSLQASDKQDHRYSPIALTRQAGVAHGIFWLAGQWFGLDLVRNAQEMLFGQYLGRGHERTLVPGRVRCQQPTAARSVL